MGKRLGVSGNWISLLESGDPAKARPSDQLIMLLNQMPMDGSPPPPPPMVVKDDEVPYRSGPKMIPVAGWAHAGEAGSYEEIPKSWQNRIPTECQDPQAFAVSLEGDSMEPKFSDGDLLVVMPSEQVYSGCFVVARFVNDGIIFRRMEMSGDVIVLQPLNERWPVSTHAQEEFSWIYPVWGRWTQIWRRR